LSQAALGYFTFGINLASVLVAQAEHEVAAWLGDSSGVLDAVGASDAGVEVGSAEKPAID